MIDINLEIMTRYFVDYSGNNPDEIIIEEISYDSGLCCGPDCGEPAILACGIDYDITDKTNCDVAMVGCRTLFSSFTSSLQ